ncbi:MAG: UbiD family decarboxylase [Candidatus Altiarchaeota archaeon]|nr:UbiD family decarboxylase [Candidatus Altiarchaeota archaeon]
MRDYMGKIEVSEVGREVNPYLEIPRILRDGGGAVHFKNVRDSTISLVGNLCNRRENFLTALDVKEKELLTKINHAIEKPSTPEETSRGSCQQVIEDEVDLSKMPIPTYTSNDMGPYLTSGVFIASDPEYGLNMSFHRATPIAKDKLVARICQRNLYEFMQKADGGLDVAICIGLHPAILLSAAISPALGVSEMDIANTLTEFSVVKCKTNDLLVPASSEMVLEGKITDEKHVEGPFLDVTRTLDYVREEPVIEITKITHRRNPIYHAILPSLEEHQLLMGMPREPLIYNHVSRVCGCMDVSLTTGGCGWLHGVVSIDKKNPDDGRKAIDAAFNAHKSMKHLVIVDSDIDVHDTRAVEWSLATRFQGETDTYTRIGKGSSLDPSAGEDRMTSKIGLDATIPFGRDRKGFQEVRVGE